jgi:Mrp family chromosome partitioning ATPase
MHGFSEELRARGILLDGARPDVSIECARMAQRIRKRSVHTIGLAPASDEVAVPPIAIELGRALAAQGTSPVGVVDAHGSWASTRDRVEDVASGEALLVQRWLFEDLAVLSPRDPGAAAAFERFLGSIAHEALAFEHFVVDLTGLDHLGEDVTMCEVLDAIVVVARSGRSTSRQVQRSLRGVPPGRSLGVLLTGL